MTWHGSAKPDGYVLGLCGAHGTGKSTILQGVKAAGYPVDESQLSRAAQKMLGWNDLKPAQESVENMWALQDAVLTAMYDRDKRINDSKILTLVDRTPADVWGYTMLWMMRLDNIGEENRRREQKFRQACRVLSSQYAKHIIVPIRDEIAFVAEKNRADADSREFHARHVMNFVAGHLDKHIVETIDPADRVEEVVNVIKNEQYVIDMMTPK